MADRAPEPPGSDSRPCRRAPLRPPVRAVPRLRLPSLPRDRGRLSRPAKPPRSGLALTAVHDLGTITRSEEDTLTATRLPPRLSPRQPPGLEESSHTAKTKNKPLFPLSGGLEQPPSLRETSARYSAGSASEPVVSSMGSMSGKSTFRGVSPVAVRNPRASGGTSRVK